MDEVPLYGLQLGERLSGSEESTMITSHSPFLSHVDNSDHEEDRPAEKQIATPQTQKREGLNLRGQQMPSPGPWTMIRYFHSTVRNPSGPIPLATHGVRSGLP